MKKIVFILFIILCIASSGCNITNDSLQEIQIKNYGTIKVPEDWTLTEHDWLLYLSNKSINSQDEKIYFIQSNSVSGIEEGDVGIVETNILCNKFQNILTTKYQVLSNSASYGECKTLVDDEEEHKFFFELSANDSHLQFVCWDENINIETIKKIANSYNMK